MVKATNGGKLVVWKFAFQPPVVALRRESGNLKRKIATSYDFCLNRHDLMFFLSFHLIALIKYSKKFINRVCFPYFCHLVCEPDLFLIQNGGTNSSVPTVQLQSITLNEKTRIV